MQKWACMAVRPDSNRKAPLRRARLAQFGIKSAPPKARALKGLGQAVRAWDATSCGGVHGPQPPPTLPTPSLRPHNCAQY